MADRACDLHALKRVVCMGAPEGVRLGHRLEMSPVRRQRADGARPGQHLEGRPLIKSVLGRVSYQTGTGHYTNIPPNTHTHKHFLSKAHIKVQVGDASAVTKSHHSSDLSDCG